MTDLSKLGSKEIIVIDGKFLTLYAHRRYRMYGHLYVKVKVNETNGYMLICANCSDTVGIDFRRHTTLGYMYGGPPVKLRSLKMRSDYRKCIRTCDEVRMDNALE